MIITNSMLESSLIAAKDNTPPYYPFLSTVLNVLYFTGCRPHEVLDLSLWSRIDSDSFLLKALKGNSPRLINKIDLPPIFINYIDNNFLPFSLINYRQFVYQFLRIYQYPSAMIDNKKCTLYLYRHAFIKRLADEGKTIEQIRQITGHKSDAIVEGYIGSLIYT